MTEWFSMLAGGLTGVLSGMGLGGGTLLMLYMTGPVGLAQHTAQGINLLYFLPCSAGALWGHIKNRSIDWRAVLPAAAAGLLAAGLTSYLAQGLEGSLLRKLFGGGVILVGLREIALGRAKPKTAENPDQKAAD